MPRPARDLSPYRRTVEDMYIKQNMSVSAICGSLSHSTGLSIGNRTLERKLHQWKIVKQVRTKKTHALKKDLEEHFYQGAVRNDRKLYQEMKERGHEVSQEGIVQLHKEIVGTLRVADEEKETAYEKVKTAVQKELDDGYGRHGREHMRVHMRQGSKTNFSSLYNLLLML